MRKLFAALVTVMILSISLAMGSAQARTPTPTATSSPSVSATPSPTATPTIPSGQVAQFHVQVWVDGRLSDAPATAKIGDVDCGQPRPFFVVCDPGPCGPSFALDVVSSQIKPGCGYEGATIQFYVGDRPAQTAIWHGGSFQGIILIVGPSFALASGSLAWNGDLPIVDGPTSTEQVGPVVPFIEDTPCGRTNVLSREASDDPSIKRYDYGVAIFSDEWRAGCGREGAPITFKLLNSNGNVLAVAREKGVWTVWDGSSDSQRLNLTIVPDDIKIGSVGTGDSQESGGTPAGVVAVGLAIAGVAAFVAGAAIRKRTVRIPGVNRRET
jgi:hypothetical protein